jgi:predicted RNase H-like nuclease
MQTGQQPVAQISNLLYRRLPVGWPPANLETPEFSAASGLEIRDIAGWKPALRPDGTRSFDMRNQH